MIKFLVIIFIIELLIIILIIVGLTVNEYLYWKKVKPTPTYQWNVLA